VHTIANGGLASLYGLNAFGLVTFGPVMAYVWAALAAIAPGFASATDAADTGLRMLLKTPASIADFGLAIVAVYALRDRPRWAVVAAVAIILQPAVWYVSAWWGQYESIYVLPALAAAVAASRGRNALAAALLSVALLTKPQAIAFVVPFAAWFAASGWRRDRWRGVTVEVVRTAAAGLATATVLWIPFLGTGGPVSYLDNLRYYQDEVFHVLSLRAWNLWWLVQEGIAGGRFVTDDVAVLGPLTPRYLGYVVTGLISVAVGVAVVRDPRPRTLYLALATSTLVFFAFMTQMHERYAFGAVIFLALLAWDTRVRSLVLATSAVVALNLVAAVPPVQGIGLSLPVGEAVSIAGAFAMVGITVVTIVTLVRNVNTS